MLGTFHFANPGLDVAKYEDANILSAKRQQEVKEVVVLLKKFKPDKIFIESTPTQQAKMDSLYKRFKEANWELKKDEVYQLGFRLAKELNLPTLHAVDYQDAHFPFDSLIKVLQQEKQYQLLQHIKVTIDSIQTSFNNSLKTSTIKKLLLMENTSASNSLSVGSYFQLLVAGGKNNHIGSYLVSEWWRRNMIIYENILKRLTGDEKNVLVIFGSSHTALLKEFLKFNPALEIVEVSSVLK
ncbi:MAG TPA: DUF5694 domain-containing protein [Segetibacter sp.]